MLILVLNSGSSSLKFSMFEAGARTVEPEVRAEGEIAHLDTDDASLTVNGRSTKVSAKTPESAIKVMTAVLAEAGLGTPDAVGYRVVHPGPKLDRHQLVTEEVLRDLDEAASFAPLHDPAVTAMIRAMRSQMPDVPHLACFDTVFHQTLPEAAFTYPLPHRFRDAGVRRYGFHGLSCESIVRRMRGLNGVFPRRLVIAHLGSGCSVTALEDGRSVDTSMGLTPDGGVVMGTRPGDLDPGLMMYLMRQSAGVAELEQMLNRGSGMVALSGMKNDLKLVRKAAQDGSEPALLALKVFTRSVRKAVGGFAWLLGGLDAVVFSGGIGEHDAQTRAEVLSGLEGLGLMLAEGSGAAGVRRISREESATAVWVIPAAEELMIAIHVVQMIGV